MNRVAVVATHPDDETLGCGGTLLKHRKAGDDVFWIVVTSMKAENGFTRKEILRREKEVSKVAGLYRFAGVYHLGFPAAELDRIGRNALTRSIAAAFAEIEPSVVYLPFKGDVHSDHDAVFRAAYGCTKVFRCPSIKKVLMMETISETELAPCNSALSFKPNYFSDISRYLDGKIRIMKVYRTEMGRHPFPRS